MTLLPEITRRLDVPRSLAVPFALGFPLGEPDAPVLQTRILRALLALTAVRDLPHHALYAT